MSSGDVKQSLNFGLCPNCRRRIKLTKTGTLWRHGPHGQLKQCAGSYGLPSPQQNNAPQTAPTATNAPLQSQEEAPPELFTAPVRSIRFIPRVLIPLTAERLASALREATGNPEDCSKWWPLLLFPQRLAEHPESRKESRTIRNEKLRAQISGASQPPNDAGPTIHRESKELALRRAVRRQIDAGQVNKAMKLVTNDGKLMAPDAQTLAALQEKHPTGSCVIVPNLVGETSHRLIIEKDSITAAIHGMSIASAAGPDGLRPSHLRQLISTEAGASRELLIDALSDFANSCVSGYVPEKAAPFFFGASLCALRKKDGGAQIGRAHV